MMIVAFRPNDISSIIIYFACLEYLTPSEKGKFNSGAGQLCSPDILFNFPFSAVLRQVNIFYTFDDDQNDDTNAENFQEVLCQSTQIP